MRVCLLILGLTMAGSGFAQSSLKMGESLPAVTLKGEDGEIVKNGEPWTSASVKGKITMICYVDPDEADLNNALTARLQEEKFDLDKFQSVAIVNMASTWKPNMVISSVLKGKQEEFPHTLYVKDYKKNLIKAWGLQDDTFHVILLDKNGQLILDKAGKFSQADIEAFVQLVKAKMAS